MQVIDPERALAITYAPATIRPALTALFALDERLGSIVGNTTEVMIGLIRLAWWREALERLDAAPPPAEPLLAAAGALILPRGVTGARLADLEDGWAALLDGAMDDAALARHAQARGAGLFAAAATLLGVEDDRVQTAGAGWALVDLGYRHSRPEVRTRALALAATYLGPLFDRAWPKPARPLGALAVLARADAAAATRRQGSPGRVARMLALRVTGR